MYRILQRKYLCRKISIIDLKFHLTGCPAFYPGVPFHLWSEESKATMKRLGMMTVA
jgi:hypothetical protein